MKTGGLVREVLVLTPHRMLRHEESCIASKLTTVNISHHTALFVDALNCFPLFVGFNIPVHLFAAYHSGMCLVSLGYADGSPLMMA